MVDMEKVMAVAGPIIERLVSLVTMLIPLVLMYFSGKYLFVWGKQFYIESSANEWLIVIRNGEMVKRGIGLCTWIMPTDQYVKFPSLINEVNFKAQ
jgi:hypothetical protein